MRNLLLTLSYKGTAYHGYQVQKNAISVAQVVQDAVERVFGSRLDIKGCSRTDTGVHANKYCVSLKTQSGIPCDAVVRAMNVSLPEDVAVLACCEVDLDFHPRYSCTAKRYVYKIHNSAVKSPFLEGLATRYPYPLDEQVLDKAAQCFVGTYDFAGFCSAGSSVQDTVRTIFSFSVIREGELVIFSVTGNGFLYNMVRILIGTLLLIAQGKITEQQIPEIIASKDRKRAGVTTPACGLYLDEVFYEPLN